MKKWNELNFMQKRHRIHSVLLCRTLYYWGICGKDRQKYYKHKKYTEQEIEKERLKIYDEYMNSIKSIFVFDYGYKISLLKGMLGIL